MANTIYLDDLLRALTAAVLNSNRMLRDQHVGNMGDHFEQDHNGVHTPKTLKMKLPAFAVPDETQREQVFDVPSSCLTNQQSMSVDEMTLEFDCLFEGLDEDSGQHRVALALSGGFLHRGRAAKVSIKLKGGDPPEGQARVNDMLLKKFS